LLLIGAVATMLAGMFGLPPFPEAIVRGLVLSGVALLWIIALTRLVGLRTFSKMTAFDFVVTLATGSLLASAATVTTWTAFVQAIAAIGAIIAMQVLLALIRRRSTHAKDAMENVPLLLMRDGRFIDAALATSRVSRADVLAKLRAANVGDFSAVRAVVLETTGDISVLHGHAVSETLIDDVRN
jgi:uncharacterized membrane protein YcaP (DUF421 family)